MVLEQYNVQQMMTFHCSTLPLKIKSFKCLAYGAQKWLCIEVIFLVLVMVARAMSEFTYH